MVLKPEWLQDILPPREEVNPLQDQFDDMALRWNLTILNQMALNWANLSVRARTGSVDIGDLSVLAELKGLMIGI